MRIKATERRTRCCRVGSSIKNNSNNNDNDKCEGVRYHLGLTNKYYYNQLIMK